MPCAQQFNASCLKSSIIRLEPSGSKLSKTLDWILDVQLCCCQQWWYIDKLEVFLCKVARWGHVNSPSVTKLFNSSFLFSSTRSFRCFFLLSSYFYFFFYLHEPSVMKNEINLKIIIVLFLYKQEPTYMLDIVGFWLNLHSFTSYIFNLDCLPIILKLSFQF